MFNTKALIVLYHIGEAVVQVKRNLFAGSLNLGLKSCLLGSLNPALVHLYPHLAECILVKVGVHIDLLNCCILLCGNLNLCPVCKFNLCHFVY